MRMVVMRKDCLRRQRNVSKYKGFIAASREKKVTSNALLNLVIWLLQRPLSLIEPEKADCYSTYFSYNFHS